MLTFWFHFTEVSKFIIFKLQVVRRQIQNLTEQQPQITPPNNASPSIDFKVKTIRASEWTITVDNRDVRLLINDKTKIMPGIAAGDTVEVLAQKNSDGTFTAILIGKLLR